MTSKDKGNSFERKISKTLSDRFKEKTGVPMAFRRNIDSGSFFGGSNQKRTKLFNLETACFGDIMCPSNFSFSIECKHYKTAPTFSMVVSGNNKQWDTWLKQDRQDSENSKKKFMLIVKYNGIPEIVFVEDEYQGVESILTYKDVSVYKLEDFLTLSDNEFFDSEETSE